MKIKRNPYRYYIIDGEVHRAYWQFRLEWERGYAEPAENCYTVLDRRKKVLGFITVWVKVAEEFVPSFVWIQRACFGWTDWKCKLMAWIDEHATWEGEKEPT